MISTNTTLFLNRLNVHVLMLDTLFDAHARMQAVCRKYSNTLCAHKNKWIFTPQFLVENILTIWYEQCVCVLLLQSGELWSRLVQLHWEEENGSQTLWTKVCVCVCTAVMKTQEIVFHIIDVGWSSCKIHEYCLFTATTTCYSGTCICVCTRVTTYFEAMQHNILMQCLSPDKFHCMCSHSICRPFVFISLGNGLPEAIFENILPTHSQVVSTSPMPLNCLLTTCMKHCLPALFECCPNSMDLIRTSLKQLSAGTVTCCSVLCVHTYIHDKFSPFVGLQFCSCTL